MSARSFVAFLLLGSRWSKHETPADLRSVSGRVAVRRRFPLRQQGAFLRTPSDPADVSPGSGEQPKRQPRTSPELWAATVSPSTVARVPGPRRPLQDERHSSSTPTVHGSDTTACADGVAPSGNDPWDASETSRKAKASAGSPSKTPPRGSSIGPASSFGPSRGVWVGRWVTVPRNGTSGALAVRVAWGGLVIGLSLFAVSTTVTGPDLFWDTIVYDALTLGAACLLWARAVLVRVERAAWMALALALTANATGDITYSLLAMSGEPAFPSVADVLYLLFYPGVYIGLLLLLRHRARRLPASAWLDGLVAACALAAAVAAVAFNPIAAAATGTPQAVAVALAYPIGDLALLAVTSGALALLGWRTDARWWAISAAMCTYAVVDTLFLLQITQDSYTEGTWIDVLWPAAGNCPTAASMAGPRSSPRSPPQSARSGCSPLPPVPTCRSSRSAWPRLLCWPRPHA
jgi:hypothetical protein